MYYLIVLILIAISFNCRGYRGAYLCKSKSFAYIVTLEGDTLYMSNREVNIYKVLDTIKKPK